MLRTCTQVFRILSFTIVTVLTCSSMAAAQTPTLMWNANSESDLGGYVVQYGTQPGSPSTTLDVGNVTSRQFSGLQVGSTYYFRVLAYNTGGTQSGPSAEVPYAVPGVPVTVSLTSISPTSGPTTGGTVITLQGSNFVSGTTVSVGGAAASSVTFISSTQLRATTPAGTAGARTVQVTTPSAQSASLANAFTYTSTTGAPTLTSVSPSSGPTAGGTVITATGTNFVSGATVRVDGVAATAVTFVSATQVRATTPAGTTGAKTVQVTNPSGVSASLANAFTYTNGTALSITSISPSSGPTAGNTAVVILGANFVAGGNLYVSIGGEPMTGLQLVSATELRGRTPAGSAGAKDLRFTNGNSQFLQMTGAYTYTNGPSVTPTLTSVSPTSGPTAGGTVITLTGTNFVSGATVRVDGVAATGVTFVSASQLRATTPAGTAGAKAVQVTNPNGQSANMAGGFTYTAASSTPTLTSVSPTSGPTAGGTVITVTGTNFVSGATVRVGGVAATAVTFVSATQVRATTPAGTTGAKTVQVTNPNGQSASLANGYSYTAAASLTLTSVSPASGPTSGGTVITLTGTGFVSGSTVRVDGVLATAATFVSATQLRATTPAGTTGAKTVQVTSPSAQSASLANAYTYTNGTALSFTSITPASGSTSGNTAVVIRGANFVAGGNLYISIGGEPLTGLQLVSSTEVRGLTAPGSAGVRDIRFTNGNGQFLQITGAYTYTNGSSLTQETDAATAGDGVARRYLAEGGVTDQMETSLSLANPQAVDANVVLTFSDTNGQATRLPVVVPARARRTVNLRDIPELVGTVFSTTLESDQVVALDRLMSWKGGLASSVATAVDEPATTWYLSDDSTTDPFELFYLLQNPGTKAADVQVRYIRPRGLEPITKTYTVAAGSRATIWVDREDPALAMTDVTAEITSLNGVPLVVERTLYLMTAPGSGTPRGAMTHAGTTTPPTAQRATLSATGQTTVAASGTTDAGARWLLAEGGQQTAATPLALVNTTALPTGVTVTLLFEDGPESSATFTVAGNARFAVPLAQAFPAANGRRFSVLVEAVEPSALLLVDRGGAAAARLP